MGNRAVLDMNGRVGIYLHWNGGADSVATFCEAAKQLKCRNDDYGVARLCQIIGNFFGGVHSIGCDTLDNLDTDNGDNGVYVIRNWEIKSRSYGGSFGKVDKDMLVAVLSKQPMEKDNGR